MKSVTRAQFFAGLALLCAVIVAAAAILHGSLRDSVHSEIYTLEQEIANLHNTITNLEAERAEAAEQANSLFSDKSYSFRDYKGDTLTAILDISAVPKAAAENASAVVMLGEKRYPMTKNGARFSVSIPISVTESYSPLFILTESEQTQSAPLFEYLSCSNFILERVKADLSGEHSYDAQKGKLSYVNANIHFSYDPQYAEIKSARLVAFTGEKEVWSSDVTDKLNAARDSVTLSFSKTFDVKKTERFQLYAEITDTDGLTFRCNLHRWTTDEHEGIPVGDVTVLDAAGKLVEFH